MLTLKQRLGLIVVVVIGAAMAASCADWAIQGWRVHRASELLTRQFPPGAAVAEARKLVDAQYPEHTRYSASECEKWSHMTVPGYVSKGGPCLFGIVRVGTTWWGFESAVEFRLIFGPDDHLSELQVLPVYTFL